MSRVKSAAGFLLLLAALAPGQQKVRTEDLNEKHQDWLKMTAYIILPAEKDVFMKLTSDRDRDIFIDSFWKQRDPTPGTPENEFRDEIAKRFKYVNIEFHKGSAREGWLTEMGRYYMILGPPVSKDSYKMRMGLRPCEVWYYYGDTSKGLPTYFGLLFFRKFGEGAGEYQLYSPAVDGPVSLLQDTKDLSTGDITEVYERLQELAPTLAPMSLSMVPGDNTGFISSALQANLIVQSIVEFPRKNINPSYAKHFLDFKGIVSTEYLTNIVEAESSISLLRDPVLGMDFLHYAVTPKSLSLDYFSPKDQYFCSYSVDVSLRRGEKIFYQYNKEFPFYFPAGDAESIKDRGLCIQDSFPVIPGSYKLIILLKNSVGKEFSVVEKDIVCEGAGAGPAIGGLVLGHRMEEEMTAVHAPFRVLDRKLVVDPKNAFGGGQAVYYFINVTNLTRELWKGGEVRFSVKGMTGAAPSTKSFAVRLADLPCENAMNLTGSVPTTDLAPDYYEMRVALTDAAGKVVAERNAPFIISPGAPPARPVVISKELPLGGAYLYDYQLAEEFDKTDDPAAAAARYEKAYAAAPDDSEGTSFYAGFLVRTGNFAKALEIAEAMAREPKLVFDSHLIKGQAQMGLGNHAKALEELVEANKMYRSDTRVLNGLGLCYARLGEKTRAVEALSASLSLNPEQPDIKKLVEELKKK